VPSETHLASRTATAILLPLGMGVTSWHYLWRTTPMSRRELTGSWDEDRPSDLPAGVSTDGIQSLADGVGPFFHRRYRVLIGDPDGGPEELMAEMQADPDCVAPREFATFRKDKGERGRLAVGDEFTVRMPGPWDGPVRAVHVTPASFRLATLEGHLEAGQIEFRATREDGEIAFEIESWARSGDRFSNVLFQHLRMAKEIQFHMWTSVLEQAVELVRGTRRGRLDIETRRIDEAELDR
jgi:Domain of unknown function (DUF1990)